MPPVDAGFDYQLGEAYPPPDGVTVVARDWFLSSPLEGGYSICYVNAYQTQPDDESIERPDELEGWPPGLVLTDLPDDPSWPGEKLVDLSSADRRERAANHVSPMLEACSEKGFDGVELDNLDSWTRLQDTGETVPFGQDEAVAYAKLLTVRAHELGLAVARKNTPQLDRETSIEIAGFDFAIAEECGAFDECDVYRDVFGAHVLVIEYSESGFDAACRNVGNSVSVILRDLDLVAVHTPGYRYDAC